MKRIKVTALVRNDFDKSNIEDYFVELEHFEEKSIQDSDVFREHSLESLYQAGRDFVNSIWTAIRAFGKLSIWSVILMLEALRRLWNYVFGGK